MPETQNISFCFATIDRPQCVQRLVRSIRRYFPTAPIFVGEQSARDHAQAEFYLEQDVIAVYLDYDAGVCQARNAIVREVQTPYLVLCDDDFIIGAETNFDFSLAILDQHSEVMVVGGRVIDVADPAARDGPDRHWESFLFLEPRTRILVQLPIYLFRPLLGQVGARNFFYCETVLNFAVMRTALFQQHGHCWDERFKCNGEHEDFYLALKAKKDLRVVYTPDMVVYHHNITDERYAALRFRQDGWSLLAEKWGVDQFHDYYKDLNLRFFSGQSEVPIDADELWKGLVHLPHGANEQVFYRRRAQAQEAEIAALRAGGGQSHL